MIGKIIKNFIIFFLLLIIFPKICLAFDSDNDGISDEDEIKIYYTNPYLSDTDGDGYDDYTEIKNGYSPHQPKLKMSETDYDHDGLNDKLEILLGTDLGNPDTDGDGYKDGEEVFSGYDPKNPKKGARMSGKIIEVGIKEQLLRYKIGDIVLGEYKVSTGSYKYPTPLGNFLIDGKIKKAYSKKWRLWMPYFLSIKKGWFGIHELPEWENGKKEGENHLGQRASHGCIRLGIGPAQKIYNWADIGTKVIIKKSFK
ncbi:MAG: L,D-transpeptidase family protein [Patescibacteria group bacterium]